MKQVWLEVIEQNEAAYRLYEKLGYDLVRWVEVWTLSAEVPPGRAREVPVEQAHARIRELRTEREPWQRSDATLAHHGDARGIETDEGAAIFRVNRPGAAQVVQIAGEAKELLQTVRSYGNVVILNVPAGDPVGDVMRDLGGAVTVRQREMVLDFAEPGLDSERPWRFASASSRPSRGPNRTR